MNKGTILVAIYGDPEYYPPTLNAIDQLSNFYKDVIVLYKIYSKSKWKYPNNVRVISSGFVQTKRNLSWYQKLYTYIEFQFLFLFAVLIYKPKVILVYDDYALASLGLIHPFINTKTKLWYHNHDATNKNISNKLSLNFWVKKYVPKVLKKVDLITFASIERIEFYNVDKNKLKAIILELRNYPSLKYFKNQISKQIENNIVKLIFVGLINDRRGLLEIIECIHKINSQYGYFKISLDIFGLFKNEELKQRLIDKINFLNLNSYIKINLDVSYNEVPNVLSKYNVGIAYYLGKDLNSSNFENALNTILSKASNKIYEYTAVGLPILTNVRFDKNHKWIITNIPKCDVIEKDLKYIISNYSELSNSAKTIFIEKYNYESEFNNKIVPILQKWSFNDKKTHIT